MQTEATGTVRMPRYWILLASTLPARVTAKCSAVAARTHSAAAASKRERAPPEVAERLRQVNALRPPRTNPPASKETIMNFQVNRFLESPCYQQST